QSDDVDFSLARRVEDLLHRHHDAQVDDVIIVTLKHDADDVLADVVHVALHCGEQDLAGRRLIGEAEIALLLLHEGHEVGDRLLHHAGRLHHLRQEHLAGAEQVADHVHAGHQRTFDDVQWALDLLPRFFSVLLDIAADAVHQRLDQPLLYGLLAPGEIDLFLLRPLALEALGSFEQAISGVRPAIQDYVFYHLAQLWVDVIVKGELAGIDDAHVHAGLDRVIEEHRMHRFTYPLIAAEGEREVRHAARDVHVGKLGLNATRRLDIGVGVIIVLLDTRRHGEDVGIEDNVLWREADLLGQQLVGTLADGELALSGLGLALLVEGHHYDRGAVAAHFARMIEKRPLAFLEADRVHDRLALHAFEPGLDHRPFRRVDHDRHARDIGLGGEQVE